MVIFVATSKQFYGEAQRLCEALEARGQRTFHPFFDRDQSAIEADPAIKIAVTREHFPELDASDMVYALTPAGYIGASVLIEITYAFALGKPVATSEPVREYAARAMVTEVVSPADFIAKCDSAPS